MTRPTLSDATVDVVGRDGELAADPILTRARDLVGPSLLIEATVATYDHAGRRWRFYEVALREGTRLVRLYRGTSWEACLERMERDGGRLVA